jgi:anthranilate phosphoribosyltransferase
MAPASASVPPAATTDDRLQRALAGLARGERLGEALVADAFGVLMSGEAQPTQAAAFLMALRVQGETGAELAGAARALRAVMRRVPLPDGSPAVDTAGTGGGVVPTFNVSTAAALVAVAAGCRVAKHGNRSYTSRSGSADVIEALGMDLTRIAEDASRILERTGMVFLFAPAFHPAMRYVAPVRRELGVPTVMNLVGPLVNPAGVRHQVVGVADPERAPVVADALMRLGVEHALVVHGRVGMDEVAPVGETLVWEVRAGEPVRRWSVEPADYGLERPDLEALHGGNPAENASRIARLLEDSRRDPAGRAVVVLNAGAAVYAGDAAASYREGVERAVEALDDGRAADVLAALRRAAASTSG